MQTLRAICASELCTYAGILSQKIFESNLIVYHFIFAVVEGKSLTVAVMLLFGIWSVQMFRRPWF